MKSKISFIDGDKGILRYRGYPIEQLAERSNFCEVCSNSMPDVRHFMHAYVLSQPEYAYKHCLQTGHACMLLYCQVSTTLLHTNSCRGILSLEMRRKTEVFRMHDMRQTMCMLM